MDRSISRRVSTTVVLAMIGMMFLPLVAGCSAVAAALYVVRGNNLPADYDGLKEKKVVVLCRPLASLTYRDSDVSTDLARRVGILLKTNVRKIELIDHREIEKWLDENGDWSNYMEVGKALEADMVVGIDLHSFTIRQSQVLYQGRADVTITVYDCAGDDDDEEVFRKDLPQTVYPPNAVFQVSDMPEREFRREFVGVLADQIGRHFYPHDAHADIALDANTLRRGQ